jgi:hypothetical protein
MLFLFTYSVIGIVDQIEKYSADVLWHNVYFVDPVIKIGSCDRIE